MPDSPFTPLTDDGKPVVDGLIVFTNDWRWGVVVKVDHGNEWTRSASDLWHEVKYPDGRSNQYNAERMTTTKPHNGISSAPDCFPIASEVIPGDRLLDCSGPMDFPTSDELMPRIDGHLDADDARCIASWWQAPAGHGLAFAQFASTGKVYPSDILAAIRHELTTSTGLDNQPELVALRRYIGEVADLDVDE